MDLTGDAKEDYYPQYSIHGVSFRFYSTEEIKSLSVKHVVNTETFNHVFQPNLGGLYDPALGPIDKNDVCYTCGQSQVNCPGHMGHIELPLPVLNPVFFPTLYEILKSTCFYCHRMLVDSTRAHLLMNQCRLLDNGHVVSVGHLEELYGQIMHEQHDKTHLSQKCRDELDQFTDLTLKGGSDTENIVKNVQALRYQLVKTFIREDIKRSGKCRHCTVAVKSLRQEHKAKIILLGKLHEETNKSSRKYTGSKMEINDNDSDDDEGFNEKGHSHKAPPQKKQKTGPKEKKSRTIDVTLLMPLKIKEHLREVWKKDGALLKYMYPSLASTSSQYPTDIFFLEILPVVPSRYRPVQMMSGKKFENPQTANLSRVMKSNGAIRELLWEIEKSVTNTEIPGDHIMAENISMIPGATLTEKLNNAILRLQKEVNCIVDSDLDKLSKDVNPGIKQLLEKKEGLFRKNMMGKRVNYAARSVISPDPNINTNEIGIPEVFAKVLTYPTPVTPWNVHELRQAVINGPNKHPGAFQVVNEDGYTVLLDRKNKIQREALAKQLLTPTTTVHGKVVTGVKKVFRHLKNGDVLLVNRQPTLHRPSIQAHKARVLRGEKTLRLHYANCKAYNADFDGDEMNAHFPQNEIARAEGYTIASTDYQYLVPKDGNPLAGLIQDHMVSGVHLTIRGRFFNKEDYCRLVYTAIVDKSGPFKLLPPAIIKPCQLWSGKQVLSTVVLNVIPNGKPALSLNGKAKVPEKSWIKISQANLSSQTPRFMGESDVIIRHGELLCGILDKGHYGPTPYGLVHCCYEMYGGAVAGKLLTCFGRLFLNFLQWKGFSLGVEDILVTKKANKVRTHIIKKSPKCGKVSAKKALDLDSNCDDAQLLSALKGAHYDLNDRQMRELDMGMRNQTNDIQNNIVNSCMPNGLEKLFPDNNLQLMVVSGAKGSSVNCMQISCLLGQIELEGKRPPLMLSGRTLPSFLPYDVTPRAGGFVTGRFLTGIRQQEYFFHCMAGREGLVDTAVKTSRSGYLQRCLIKHLEGIKINYDLTVRDGDSSVIQFYYGEDSLDINKIGFLNNKQFPFLAENHEIMQSSATSSQNENKKKISKLEHKIKKWHKKRGNTSGCKIRQSGFLKFCQDVGADVMVNETETSEKVPGRSNKNTQLCQMWAKLKVKQKNKYNEGTKVCPDPVLSKFSPYNTSALSERLSTIIHNYAKQNSSTEMGGLNDQEFCDLMNVKLTQCVAEPGDAVGLLCAQSIGEPSTQMTLNTFHFAGRGEMNVTLGIPRLREVLMVGSKNLKTPAMDAPVLPGAEMKEKAKKLQKLFAKVHLNDVLKGVQVQEWLAIKGQNRIQRKRVFKVRFNFLPWPCYKERFCVSPNSMLLFIEKVYVKRLILLIKKKINTTSKSRLISHGTKKESEVLDEEDGELPKLNFVADEEDDEDDEEEMDADGDGDKGAVKEKRKHMEEHEYEDEEEEDCDNMATPGNSDDELDMDLSEAEDVDEEMIKEYEEKDNKKNKNNPAARIHSVLQLAAEVEDYSYDKKHKLWCEVTLNFSLLDSKVDLLALLEMDVRKTVVHEVTGISRCFLGDQTGPQGTELHLKTEGINMHELYKYNEFLDLNRLYCNNIHSVAETYGIEAASKIIIKEIQAVFAAYGIEVDYRHLSLLADYMTFEGCYKPFNRAAMESNPSPLQKMSFETTMHFLLDSSIKSHTDNLKSPSAQIVLGKNVTCGTGCHELLNPIVTF